MKIKIHCIYILLILASCAAPSSEKEAGVEKGWVGKLGFQTESDPYLKILGDSIRELKTEFPQIAFIKAAGVSRVTFDLENDSLKYEVEVFWPEETTSEVNLDVFPKDSAQTAAIFKGLTEYYNSKLENGSQTDAYAVWYTQSLNGVDVEISLIDESRNYGKPYLSIIYFLEDGIAD